MNALKILNSRSQPELQTMFHAFYHVDFDTITQQRALLLFKAILSQKSKEVRILPWWVEDILAVTKGK